MKRRIFLHLGLHKTGTSSIQVELTRARHLLASRGFLYPKVGLPAWAPYGQHLLPWSVVSDESLIPTIYGHRPTRADLHTDDIWSLLGREIEDADVPNVIISSEEFDTLDKPAIDRLAKQLSKYEIVPILFLRNPSDLIESGYRTAVLVSRFEESIDFFANNHRTRLDYYNLLKDWASIATDKFLVASYDDPHLRRDIVATFLHFLGLGHDAIELHRLPKQNESMPAFVVALIRLMRATGTDEEAIERWLRDISAAAVNFDSARRYVLLSDSLRSRLDAHYISELDKVRADPSLAGIVYGQLLLPEGQADRTVLTTPGSALISLCEALIKTAS